MVKIATFAKPETVSGNGRTTITTTMRQIITYILLLTTFVCSGTTTKVTRIIDGDTFETETGEKVRLIGINAPEISDIFGQEAITRFCVEIRLREFNFLFFGI